MSHNGDDIDPCLGCSLRLALESWWDRVKETGDKEKIRELSHPDYALTVIGMLIADILVQTTHPEDRDGVLDDLLDGIRADIAEQEADERATHDAPEAVQ